MPSSIDCREQQAPLFTQSLKYIQPEDLAHAIIDSPKDILIVDLRDTDYTVLS